MLIVKILNKSGKKVNFTYFLFFQKTSENQNHLHANLLLRQEVKSFSFGSSFWRFACRKKKKKKDCDQRNNRANWGNPREKSSVVLVAASQRKLPLIIFCAQCVIRWCSLVFYKRKRPLTLMTANEELLKSSHGNSRWMQFCVAGVCYASVRLHSENKCVFPIVLTLVIDTSVMFLWQIIVGNIIKWVKKDVTSQNLLEFLLNHISTVCAEQELSWVVEACHDIIRWAWSISPGEIAATIVG